MTQPFNITVYEVSVWILPLIAAITFHEAAHGFAARFFGDDTAWRLGRVSFNPLKHIDAFGTILLPAMLLLLHAPFLIGYAKPVPVNFRALRQPREDMVWVAAVGPVMNLLLAIASGLAFHLVAYVPLPAGQWIADNLGNSLLINVVLAIFNLLPLPPLDGGRIAVGLLPDPLSAPLARLEPYGMLILIGLLVILPLVSAQLGENLDFAAQFLARSTSALVESIHRLTGNA